MKDSQLKQISERNTRKVYEAGYLLEKLMFRSLDLLWQLFRYNPGKPDNADLIAKVVIHFTGNSLDNQIELWSKTETGQRYLRGERIIDNIESFRDRDKNTLGQYHNYG